LVRLSFLIVFATLSFAQQPDSLIYPSPKKAGMYALLFPGAGQLYNGRYLKAAFILSLEGISIWRYSENANSYANFDESIHTLGKHRYLEKRNKYIWWAAFLYLYGFLDAVVDAHLYPFDQVMEEDLEVNNQ
jgi:hypothetical protein